MFHFLFIFKDKNVILFNNIFRTNQRGISIVNQIHFLSKSYEPSLNLKLIADHRIDETEKMEKIQQKIDDEHYDFKKGLCLAATVGTVAAGILIAAFVSIPVGIAVAVMTVVPALIWRAYCNKQSEDQVALANAKLDLTDIYGSVGSYLEELRRKKSNAIIENLKNAEFERAYFISPAGTDISDKDAAAVLSIAKKYDNTASEEHKNALIYARKIEHSVPSLTYAARNFVNGKSPRTYIFIQFDRTGKIVMSESL